MERKGFLMVPYWVLRIPITELNGDDKLFLAKIIDLNKTEKGCYISNNALKDMFGMSRTSASKRITKLKKLGYIITNDVFNKGVQIGRVITLLKGSSRSSKGSSQSSKGTPENTEKIDEGIVPEVGGGSSQSWRGVVPEVGTNIPVLINNINIPALLGKLDKVVRFKGEMYKSIYDKISRFGYDELNEEEKKYVDAYIQ